MNVAKISVAAAVLVAVATGVFLLRQTHPELFRKKTEMEKTYPVCVLGVSDPSGIISEGNAGIRNIFINWKTSFPKTEVMKIRSSGAVPMITWEPYLEDIRHDDIMPAIAGGKYDAYIMRFAAQAGDAPLLIRFGHEPNGDWYGWSGSKSSPPIYAEAFRHVRKIFLSQNNNAAKFIFSVNGEDVPNAPWNRFENYYPGDDFVDIIGIDAYNWGDGKNARQKRLSPGRMLSRAYERIVTTFPYKPVFITETASCEQGSNKQLWIKQLLASIDKRFPAVKAVIWFNIRKECDWTLSSYEQRGGFYGACGNGRFDCSDKSLSWLFSEKR